MQDGGPGFCDQNSPLEFVPPSATPVRGSSPLLSRLTFTPFRLQPPHRHFPTPASARYYTQGGLSLSSPRADLFTDHGLAVPQTRVRYLLESSPTGLAESSSLSLRTGASPQVALHLFSRIRSYHCRIQGGNVALERTSTSLIKRLPRRTSFVSPRRSGRMVR